MQGLKILTVLVAFGFILAATIAVHPFGSPGSAPMDDYFIDNSQTETGANSVVSAVLFDYRGLDTLGEASVLFAAASGLFMLFRRRGKDE